MLQPFSVCLICVVRFTVLYWLEYESLGLNSFSNLGSLNMLCFRCFAHRLGSIECTYLYHSRIQSTNQCLIPPVLETVVLFCWLERPILFWSFFLNLMFTDLHWKKAVFSTLNLMSRDVPVSSFQFAFINSPTIDLYSSFYHSSIIRGIFASIFIVICCLLESLPPEFSFPMMLPEWNL